MKKSKITPKAKNFFSNMIIEDERNRNLERKNDHLKSDLTDVKNEITVTMNPINSTVVNRIILYN